MSKNEGLPPHHFITLRCALKVRMIVCRLVYTQLCPCKAIVIYHENTTTIIMGISAYHSHQSDLREDIPDEQTIEHPPRNISFPRCTLSKSDFGVWDPDLPVIHVMSPNIPIHYYCSWSGRNNGRDTRCVCAYSHSEMRRIGRWSMTRNLSRKIVRSRIRGGSALCSWIWILQWRCALESWL